MAETKAVQQYALKSASIDAKVKLTGTQMEIAGRINSERITIFLRNMHESFAGWVDFSITVNTGGDSKLSLRQVRHSLTLEGAVKNFDLEDLRTRMENKQERIESAVASALHKLAGQESGSEALDMLSNIIAEKVKSAGEATEIKPRGRLSRLLRFLRLSDT